MNNYNTIDLSIIIPVFNVEDYLSICLDSLMLQGDLCLEIILVDDGSTDQSGKIADKYAQKDDRFKVIHQENRGASAARNVGLDIAKGEYIVFLDSDDWIQKESLPALYKEVTLQYADIVMGNIRKCYQDGQIDEPLKGLSGELPNETLSGKDGFIWLIKRSLYLPMVFIYIYRRTYLEKIQIRFEEGIMHEDELWTPVVLSQAKKIVITDIDFYYYRQNENSVMYKTNLFKRLNSLFKVTDQLIKFINKSSCSIDNEELKNWWLVNIYKLYCITFTLLSKVKDTSYLVPKFHMEYFWKNCNKMSVEALHICRHYYQTSETALKKYIDWRISDWVASIDSRIKANKKLALVFNTINNEDISVKIEEIPVNWIITTDRSYFQRADLIVFHLPSLYLDVENDLDKRDGQIWANCYLESEKDDLLINDPEVKTLFDLSIIYRHEKQEEHTLVRLCRNADMYYEN